MVNLIHLGLLFVMLGVLLLFVGSFTAQEKGTVRSAGGIFLGPIPLFGFATDKNMLYTLLIITVVLTFFFLLFQRSSP